MKERSLTDAIQQFKSGIKKTDYGKVKGGKDYLSVAYRLKFCREYFGEKMSIQTESIELSNGSHKFKANIYLNDKLVSVGESKQMSNKEKDFEKSQTVSIGRGLSLLGFFGDEIASKDEMESFLQDDKPFENEKEVGLNAVIGVKDKKIENKKSIKEIADEWIGVMQNAAQNETSVGRFEKNLNPLRKEYLSELHQINSDLIQQARVDQEEVSLHKQITNRKK
mgnify:FL=1|tara:strand:- start:3377 stop:4045 length:669 start_codon:yes stop_codon:yes gene_type:complete